MITVAATVLFGTEPAHGTAGVEFPGLVEWVGSAQDDEGTFYVTIADELGDRLLEAEADGQTEFVNEKLGHWKLRGDTYWFDHGVTRIGIRPEDVFMEVTINGRAPEAESQL